MRHESPHNPVTELYCDEFRRGPAYKTLRSHGGGDWLLIYTEAGSGRFVSPTATWKTKPGDAVLYAPGDPQDYSTAREAGKWHLLWVHFMPKPHWQMWLHWPVAEGGVRCLHFKKGGVRDQFRAAMLRMIRMSRREIPGALDLASNGLEEALLWANVVSSKDPWLAMDSRVRKAVDYLVANLREPFLLEKLAAQSGCSVSRLSHLFKEQAGVSPQQFLERHRMQHACQLLRLTSLGIAEVAAEVGYEDAFYFTNRFRRYAGKNPSQFRKSRAEN